MKRIVFILLTFGLLLTAELVTQLALMEHATGQQVQSTRPGIRIHDIGFYYMADADTRLLDLKSQWQNSHVGAIPEKTRLELSKQAYEKSDVESAFEQWRFHGGPAPEIFSAKLHMYNTASQALLDVPVKVTVKAKVGELRVDPDVQMTDFNHLAQTAQWQTISTKTITIPAVAPGEDLLVPVMTFDMLSFLQKHPNQWPKEVQVEVSSKKLAGGFKKQLQLVPDHFMVPGVDL